MRFNALSAAALAALALAGSGCNKSGGGASGEFLKSKSGLEYQLFRKDASGKWQPLMLADVAKTDTAKQSKPGRVMFLQIVQLSPKDSVLLSSYEQGAPFPYQIPPAGTKPTLDTEPMTMLAAGDSGVFHIPADSILRKIPVAQRPKFLPAGSKLTLRMKIEEILPMGAARVRAQALQAQAMAKQQVKEQQRQAEEAKTLPKRRADDSTALLAYVKQHPEFAKATRLPTGVYVLTTKPGTGPKPKAGQLVAVRYRGTLLDGKEFDKNLDAPEPMEYGYSQGQMIPGFDQAVGELTKGAKATVLMPSTLAYGTQGSPPRIPANAPLMFELELVGIKDAPQAQAMPQPGDAR